MNSLTILFIVTSHALIPATNEATGVWLEELATPYYYFQDAGVNVTIASVKGGPIPIDPRSIELGANTPQSVTRILADKTAQHQITSSAKFTNIDISTIDAVFFPGGHGTMWDYPNNPEIATIINNMLANKKPVAAVCHGPAAFVGVNDDQGTPVIASKRIATFTNSEEEAVGLTDAVPFLLETKLAQLGAIIDKTDNFASHAVRDGLIITGQNPASSEKVAQLVLEALQ